MLSSTEYLRKSPVGCRWCWTPQPAWLLARAGVTTFHQSCMVFFTGCRWPRRFSSRLRLPHLTASVASVYILQRRLHHSGRHLQSSKPPFGWSRWHVCPANHDTAARPTKLPCCCSNCLEQSFSSLRSPSISRGQFRAGLTSHLFNRAYISLFKRFVLRVNLLTYLLICGTQCFLLRLWIPQRLTTESKETITLSHLCPNGAYSIITQHDARREAKWTNNSTRRSCVTDRGIASCVKCDTTGSY